MLLSEIANWQTAQSELDEYAFKRKNELDTGKLSSDASLIKTYMLETRLGGLQLETVSSGFQRLFSYIKWNISPLDDDRHFRIYNEQNAHIAFGEVYAERYINIHTVQKSTSMDAAIRNLINLNPKLDYVWLAGSYLELIWEQFIQSVYPEKYTSMKFEHISSFEMEAVQDRLTLDDIDDPAHYNKSDFRFAERRASAFSVTAKIRKITDFLPELQNVLPDFRAIKMLRFPSATAKGGYDFWERGKVTYRSNSFIEGLSNVNSVLRDYNEATETIEDYAWFNIEKSQLPGEQGRVSINGTPISFEFDEPLEYLTFENFMEITFRRGQGPFRLWGTPIRRSQNKYHVYGIDMHLWQQIYMELTPKRFLIILPSGSCGNTVHRLTANIQRFLSPSVKVSIGDHDYRDIVLTALRQ